MPTYTRNSSASVNNSSEEAAPFRVRYVLGESTCVFEPAKYIAHLVGLDDVIRLFNNPKIIIKVTDGRSLGVYVQSPNLLKFVGFVTAVDKNVSLYIEDADGILADAKENGIAKDLTAEEVVGLF